MGRKRKYKPATDGMILLRLLDGSLRVSRRCVVWSHGKRIKTSFDSRGRYEFVRVYAKGHRKKIGIARLVWMQHHKRTVPEGAEIHHKRGRSRNWITDVELLSKEKHFEETYGYPPSWALDGIENEGF